MAVEIIDKRKPVGYVPTKEASVNSAKVAAIAREALENMLGHSIVSKQNFLPPT
ncbi:MULTISPECIES: hypothetical protein [Rhodomicrobium]|uniref:hypothetical protein n=1 Tax=Rhodomicrobium TaxID=1068 RepID=UPI001483A1D4|nr:MULTISPECIES: hypothetical protein [Rhodomicrobium]